MFSLTRAVRWRAGKEMRMMKYILPAAVATFLAVSSNVSAAPAVAPAGMKQIDTRAVTDVQHRRDRDGRRHRDARPRHHYKRRYHPGRRYRTAPPGYRRYYSRPYDWRTRGCVIVGPLWFCP